MSSAAAPLLEGVEDCDGDGEVDAIGDEMEALLGQVPEADRAAVLRRLSKMVRPSPTPRAGTVLGAVVDALPQKETWTMAQIKEAVADEGVKAKPKEIYNAVSYLARRGQIRQVGYGQYLIVDLGVGLTTLEDLGVEPKVGGE